MKLIKLLILSIFLLILNPVNGATIWTNTITDANPSMFNPYTNGQTVISNVIVSGISRGPEISANAGANRLT